MTYRHFLNNINTKPNKHQPNKSLELVNQYKNQAYERQERTPTNRIKQVRYEKVAELIVRG